MGKRALKFLAFAAGAFAAWAYAIKPRTKNKPDMSVLLNYDYANRGLHNYKEKIPENSLLSFDEAAKKGYGIVVDVRLTKDGEAAVISDRDLFRMCSKDGYTEKMKLSELTELSLNGTEEKIHSLRDVLEFIDGRVPVIVRLNTYLENYGNLCQAVSEALDEYDGVFAVISDCLAAAAWFRSYRDEYIRGRILDKQQARGNSLFETLKKLLAGSLLSNIIARPDFIACSTGCKKTISLRLMRLLFFVPVMHWNVNSEEEYENSRLEDACVIFDDIEP